jgi:predicted RNA-binding Zn ribbon-like protein
VDAALVRQFLALRDPALRLLRAAAAGGELPAEECAALNRSARRYPAVRLVGDYPGLGRAEPVRAGDREGLLATLTAAVVDLLTRPDVTDLALCDAPGCGQLYLRARPNQRWCGPGCGARARSERHHRRADERARHPA